MTPELQQSTALVLNVIHHLQTQLAGSSSWKGTWALTKVFQKSFNILGAVSLQTICVDTFIICPLAFARNWVELIVAITCFTEGFYISYH